MVSNKNILIAQGGGPTNVINQSLVGIIQQERKYKSKIFGSINGVNGIINNRFISLNKVSENKAAFKYLEESIIKNPNKSPTACTCQLTIE